MEGETAADRIKARHVRANVKKGAVVKQRDGTTALAESVTGAARTSKAVRRVAEAMTTLDSTKATTIAEVTSVRLEADQREQERRAAEDGRVQDRLHLLREEAAASGRANAAVQMKWNDILERNLPQELAAELQVQRGACGSILASKDDLITHLSSEMTQKDDEYVKSLQAQRSDIERLIARMSKQFRVLSAAYESELGAIEVAFLQEREELMASNKKEIDGLFEQRRNMETRYAEDGMTREEAYARELYEMQAADAENYQKLKVKLETDVAILEQQLEHMKFTYLLNTEKLEYNYRVLTERDNENKATLTAQKQRLMRLRAALAKSQAEYESSDKRYKDRNALLTQDFQRITRQYRELQGKYKHFEIADAHRHAEVTSLHQEELGAMVERLVAADRVITEQLLGWTWVPVAPAATLQIGSARGTTALGSDPASSASPEFPEPAADAFVPSSVEEAYPVARVMASDAADTEIDAQQSVQGADATTAAALPRYKLRGMLALIVQECGRFLLDRSVIAACERLESADDRKEDLAAVVRADAVLHAIGCTSVSAAASLLQAFEDAIRLAALAEVKGSSSSEEAEDFIAKNYALDSDEVPPRLPASLSVVRVLKNWIESDRATRVGDPGGSGRPGASPVPAALSRLAHAASEMDSSSSAGEGTAGPSPQVAGTVAAPVSAAVAEAAYWSRVAHTIPDRTVRIWRALDAGLQKYRAVLVRRSGLMAEVHGLEASNAQLRQLLAQYMTDPANAELHIPPAATVRIDPASLAVLSSSAVRQPAVASTPTGSATRASSLRSSPMPSRRIGGALVAEPITSGSQSYSSALEPSQSGGLLSVTSSPVPVHRSKQR